MTIVEQNMNKLVAKMTDNEKKVTEQSLSVENLIQLHEEQSKMAAAVTWLNVIKSSRANASKIVPVN